MSELVNIVNRFVAPFGYGVCMAAAASAESFHVMALALWLAYVCAVLSMKTGRQALERGLARMSGLLGMHRADVPA